MGRWQYARPRASAKGPRAGRWQYARPHTSTRDQGRVRVPRLRAARLGRLQYARPRASARGGSSRGVYE
eukprot:8926337-Pyramimonas_sp.AAC.1